MDSNQPSNITNSNDIISLSNIYIHIQHLGSVLENPQNLSKHQNSPVKKDKVITSLFLKVLITECRTFNTQMSENLSKPTYMSCRLLEYRKVVS